MDISINNENQIFSKTDEYESLFRSVINIFKMFQKKNACLYEKAIMGHIKTNYEGSAKILQTAIHLICNGYGDPVFSFLIESEFNKAVLLNPSVTENELFELTLTKELVRHIRANNPEHTYTLLVYVCTDNIRNKLVPTIDWINMPI